MHITLRIIWATQKDTQVCPVCKALEGYSWSLSVGDSTPKELIHPVYGSVYDMRPAADCSLVKEENSHICRCTLKHEFELSKNKANGDGTSNHEQ